MTLPYFEAGENSERRGLIVQPHSGAFAGASFTQPEQEQSPEMEQPRQLMLNYDGRIGRIWALEGMQTEAGQQQADELRAEIGIPREENDGK